MVSDTDRRRTDNKNVACRLIAAKWAKMRAGGKAGCWSQWGKGDKRWQYLRCFRFGAQRAEEREEEGQRLLLAIDKGGQSGRAQIVRPGCPLPL